MPEEEVIERDATQPVVPDKGPGKDEVTISKAELEGLRRELSESQKSERDWASFHRRGGQDAEPAAEPEDQLDASQFIDPEAEGAGVQNDTPEKLVDDLAAEGVAGLTKRGFITAVEAQKLAFDVATKVSRELIGREEKMRTTDATLLNEFPELRDQNSELFKATAIRYQKAVAMDPQAKKTPAALYLAADAARESLKARKPARRDTDDEDLDTRGNREDESDRRRRADSQDSRPKGRAETDDFEDMLGSEARTVIEKMGITDEEYKAARKETLAGRGRKR
jgi:hypothetical protein